MTRWPPTILSVASTADGGIEVTWEVDSFFADAAEPEKVLVDLNGVLFKELDGDETSIEIPAETLAALGTATVVISISFWWSGSPPEEKQSSVSVPLQTGGPGPGPAGVLPAAKPIVRVVQVRPRTLLSANTIEIAWQSNNYNDGNIVWGPASNASAFRRSIRPRGEVYSGTFVTDQPLTPATQYFFKVEVRNTLHSPTWLSTTIVVRSANDTLSVREFLVASGRPVTTSLASVAGPSRSLRKMLVG
jgi:hypothetical protein